MYQPDAEYCEEINLFLIYYKGYIFNLKEVDRTWVVSHRKQIINESDNYTDAIKAIISI